MSADLYRCTLCGKRFNPEEHASCGSCPLNSDCSMVCCPACGFSTVVDGQSKVVKWITLFLRKDAVREKA